MNYIREYYKQISTGKINACKDIINTYCHLVEKLDGVINDGYHFDNNKADRIIAFAENYVIMPQTNKRCDLLLWEKAMLSTIFGFVDDNGNRQYNEVFALLGRKNGKSAIGAIIAIYMLLADGESEPQIYSSANSQQQAKLLWTASSDIIRKSPELRNLIKVRTYDMTTKFNGGVFRYMSSEKSTLDGLNTHCCILDEQHAAQTSEVYDLMVDSMSARQQPLTLIISTNGFTRDAFFDAKIKEYEAIINGYKDNNYVDNRRLPLLYRLDKKEEWTDRACWIKSNPSIGIIRSYDKLAEDVERAKKDDIKRRDIMVKFFNMPESSQTTYFSYDDVDIHDTYNIEDFRGSYYIGGFDLSEINDITSVCAIIKKPHDDTIYVLSQNFVTNQTINNAKQIPYYKWIERGYCVNAGDKIDDNAVLDWFLSLQEQYELLPYKIGYDTWKSKPIIEKITKQYGKICTPVRQGAKTLTFPLKFLKDVFVSKNINYNNNQLMKFHLTNFEVKQDINGGLQPYKHKEMQIKKNDAAMALLDAITVLYENFDDYNNLIDEYRGD